jgi:uncharacterized coiled-coil DUF342 family protein
MANPTEEDLIRASHPTKTGRHDLYAEAMRLVGARHAKGDLVDLVTWLLHRAEYHEGIARQFGRKCDEMASERDAAQAEAMIFESYAKAHQRERMRENARANDLDRELSETNAKLQAAQEMLSEEIGVCPDCMEVSHPKVGCGC